MIPLNTINLRGQWNTLWGPLQSAAPTLMNVLSFVAMMLAIVLIVKYFIDRRKGSGGNSKELLWTGLLCVLLAAPNLFIPTVLTVVDWIANFAIQLFQRVIGV